MTDDDNGTSALRVRNVLALPLHVQFSQWQVAFNLLPGADFVLRQRMPPQAYFELDRTESREGLADLFVHGWAVGGSVVIGEHETALLTPPWRESAADQRRDWPELRHTVDEIGVLLSDSRSHRPRLVSAGRVLVAGTTQWLTAAPEPGNIVTIEVHDDHFAVLGSSSVRASPNLPA